MIRKLGQDKKADWPGHLTEIVPTYNATQSAMMGYSPHYLMFGCRPRLPVDFYFPTFRSTEVPRRGASAKHLDEYMATVWDQLRATLQEALIQLTAEAQWQKWYYNWKIGPMDLKPGDMVLVKADTFQGKRKIRIGGRTSLMRWLSDHNRHPLIWSDRPAWAVMCPTPQQTPLSCIRCWHSLMYGCLPSMGPMYQPHHS